jgi:Skp family chaperone for outer membrane proteins
MRVSVFTTAMIKAGAGVLTSGLLASASFAQTATSFIVVNPDAAIAQSAAFGKAESALKTQYVGQLNAATKLRDDFAKEDTASVAAMKAEEDRHAPQATLEGKARAIVARRQQTEAEIEKNLAPVKLAEAYVISEIRAHLESATRTVMTKRGAGAVFTPASAQLVAPGVDATGDVVTALNAEVPEVSTQVPLGWQPGQPLTK